MYDNLDGAVVLYLLVGGVLTLVVGGLALAAFKRAVARNMKVADWAPANLPSAPVHQPRRAAATPLDIRIVDAGTVSRTGDASAQVLRQLAAAHAGAGLVFGITGAVLLLLLGGLEFLPLRLSVVVLALAWPTVLSLCILVGPDWRVQGQFFLGYGAVLAAFCGFAWAIGTPELSLGATGEVSQPASSAVTLPGFVQPAFVWAVYASPSVFLLLFLNRTVRAVGPLVLVFFFIMLLGGHVSISMLEVPAITGLAADRALAIGLGSLAVFWGVFGLGLAAGGWAGWRVTGWLVHLYATKRISDLTLTIGAIWLLQTLVLASGLFREAGAFGLAAAFLPMLAWAATLNGAQRLLATRAASRSARHLLFLRVFGFGRRTRRLIDLLGPRWRQLGSIQVIAAPDLASRAVEPSTFLEFVRGRLQDLFLRTPRDLQQRLESLDLLPDRDGRYRINLVYCSGEIWKAAVRQLMESASLIAMDLRGFGQERRGCVFELQTLLDTVPLNRLVLLTDVTTDLAALESLLQERWQDLDAASPNHVLGPAELRLLDTGAGETAVVRALLTFVEPRQDASGQPAAAVPIR